MDLSPPSAPEERLTGTSSDQILERDHGGPIRANRKDEPWSESQKRAEETESTAKRERTMPGVRR